MCSAPVFATVMCHPVWKLSLRLSCLYQSVLTLDVRRSEAADTVVGAAARRVNRNDRDFGGLRGIRQRDRHTVVMRSHVQRVLMCERDVDRASRCRALGHGG